jgi:hypothetical protein
VACLNCQSQKFSLSASHAPTVEVLTPRDVPLEVADVEFDTQGEVPHGGSYRVRNKSQKGLVTLVTTWTFRDDASPAHQATITHVADSWDRDTPFLGSGSEHQVRVSFGVRGYPVRHISTAIVYAEFDDGTRLGAGRDSIHASLACDRQKLLADYRQLYLDYGAGKNVEQELLQSDAGRMDWLKDIHAAGGIDAVITEISRRRDLVP